MISIDVLKKTTGGQKRHNTRLRRKQIIEAARKLIIRRGSEHIRIKEIADAVGLTEGAIYRHFKSKKEILSLLIEAVEEDLVGDIKAAVNEGGPVIDILEEVLKSHVSAIEQRRGISFLVIAEIISLGDKKLDQKISGVIAKYTTNLKELLAIGIASGEFSPALDLDAAAALFFGMVQGLVNTWALNGYNFKLEEKYEPQWRLYRLAVLNN
jgi:AcrR family transcriptional regulator